MRHTLDLRRSPSAFVIDHVMPHFGQNRLSIHVLEESIDRSGEEDRAVRLTGFDIDDITPEELGIPDGEDLLEALNKTMLREFVEQLSGGVEVRIEEHVPAAKPEAE